MLAAVWAAGLAPMAPQHARLRASRLTMCVSSKQPSPRGAEPVEGLSNHMGGRSVGHKKKVRHHVNPLKSVHMQRLELPERWVESRFRDSELPMHVDIGCARGVFCLDLAAKDPALNVVGLEIRNVLAEAANEDAERLGLSNAAFYACNANVNLRPLLERAGDGCAPTLRSASIQCVRPRARAACHTTPSARQAHARRTGLAHMRMRMHARARTHTGHGKMPHSTRAAAARMAHSLAAVASLPTRSASDARSCLRAVSPLPGAAQVPRPVVQVAPQEAPRGAARARDGPRRPLAARRLALDAVGRARRGGRYAGNSEGYRASAAARPARRDGRLDGGQAARAARCGDGARARECCPRATRLQVSVRQARVSYLLWLGHPSVRSWVWSLCSGR
jgi:hypothetical protein